MQGGPRTRTVPLGTVVVGSPFNDELLGEVVVARAPAVREVGPLSWDCWHGC